MIKMIVLKRYMSKNNKKKKEKSRKQMKFPMKIVIAK